MSNLKIKFNNGDVYLVPVDVIATERTKYYANVDGFSVGSKEWEEEMIQSREPYEVIDWVQNNMDWVDIKDFATKLLDDTSKYNHDKEFMNCEFDII